MALKTRNTMRMLFADDRVACIVVILVNLCLRIPFLKSFDLVSYDGASYVNQAKAMVGGDLFYGTWPIGYPIFIALLYPVVGDGVRAAQLVSVVAGVGSLVALYFLAKQFVRQHHAFAAALILAITPLFIRLSMNTMSELIYILWLVLGVLMFARSRDTLSGIFVGMAAITRPEALGIMAGLALVRRKQPRRLLIMLVSFLVVYSVNATRQSITLDRVVLLPKSGLFGSGAGSWIRFEPTLNESGNSELDSKLNDGDESVFTYWLRRVPQEMVLLNRHVLPVALWLAFYGIMLKRTFLLAALIPFIVFPLFAPRSEPRFLLPFIPVLIIYAMVGLESITKDRLRYLILTLLAGSAVLGVFVNRDQLTTPVSAGNEWSKRIGIAYRGRIAPDTRIADRKPFFAFYAGGRYTVIPMSKYENIMDHLVAQDVGLLVLHQETIEHMRGTLKPLLYDPAFINGELRFRQVYPTAEHVLIYERTSHDGRVDGRDLLPADGNRRFVPSWSPDGKSIAYRLATPDGEGWICIGSLEGNEERLLKEVPRQDALSWSPDSRRLAFARGIDGNLDICTVDVLGGEVTRVTYHVGADRSPSWSATQSEIVFSSDRSGTNQIWSRNLATGELVQITTEKENTYPALSPDGSRVACIQSGESLAIIDRETGHATLSDSPRHAVLSPAWSPDGHVIAVTGGGYGGTGIYLVTPDGKRSLILTETGQNDAMPGWSPTGREMVLRSGHDQDMGVRVVSGLEPYYDRLLTPAPTQTLQPYVAGE